MKNLIQGGQVVLHQIRMFKQVIRILLLNFMLTLLIITIICMLWQVEDKTAAVSLLTGKNTSQLYV